MAKAPTKRRGRPVEINPGRHVGCRLREPWYSRLTEWAEAERRPVSHLISIILQDTIEARGKRERRRTVTMVQAAD